MELEITKGLIMVGAGIGGIILSIVGGIVVAMVMSSSRKKLRQRLDEVYKV